MLHEKQGDENHKLLEIRLTVLYDSDAASCDHKHVLVQAQGFGDSDLLLRKLSQEYANTKARCGDNDPTLKIHITVSVTVSRLFVTHMRFAYSAKVLITPTQRETSLA